MLKVGLIGAGFMGRMHSSVYNAVENATLVGVFDANQEAAKAHAEKFSCKVFSTVDELYGEVDAVDVCLPTHLHREFTVSALVAGKDVLCEKPMALSYAEAQAMIDAEKSSGRRLMIAHCIRFWPEYALLKQIVDDKRYGELLSLNLTRHGEFPHWGSNNWLADEKLAGGGALDMIVHDVDYALYVLGLPKTAVSFGSADERGLSHIFSTYHYPNNKIVHIEGGWNLMPGSPFKMAFRAIFENATILMDGGPMTIYARDAKPLVPAFPKMAAAGGGNISDLGGYYHEIKHFVDRILTGEPFDVTTPESSLASLKLAAEQIQSSKAKALN